MQKIQWRLCGGPSKLFSGYHDGGSCSHSYKASVFGLLAIRRASMFDVSTQITYATGEEPSQLLSGQSLGNAVGVVYGDPG